MSPQHSLWREDGEGAVAVAAPVGTGLGTEGAGPLGSPSGAGDLVWGHEPCVPKGPERHSAIRPDHQVGDAAVVEREAEPAFWRELQCPGRERVCWNGGLGQPSDLSRAETHTRRSVPPVSKQGVPQRREALSRCLPVEFRGPTQFRRCMGVRNTPFLQVSVADLLPA